MTIEGFDHVQLAMPEGGEAVAAAFYEGRLGLAQVTKPAMLAGRGGCWFENENLKLHLGVEHQFVPARKAHPALAVRDLAAFVDGLRAQGVDVSDEEPLHGRARAFLDDPFGNRIELIEPAAAAQ